VSGRGQMGEAALCQCLAQGFDVCRRIVRPVRQCGLFFECVADREVDDRVGRPSRIVGGEARGAQSADESVGEVRALTGWAGTPE
jgi:hypothetical protein